MSNVLEQLIATIAARRQADPEQSYVASLHDQGLNKILEKVGEEATEVIIAAKDFEPGGNSTAVVGEVADLWFHSMVMLSHLEIDSSEVMQCLDSRFGISGLDEKSSRKKQGD
jgi:phosphoribosyl-ATP pyrophosphohydrolase